MRALKEKEERKVSPDSTPFFLNHEYRRRD